MARQILWLAYKRGIFLTPMQLLKLVYISHGWMLALHNRSLVRESVEAWQYGPVAPKVYHEFKKFGGNHITVTPSDYSRKFDEQELDIMKQVVEAYSGYTGIQLSSLTHQVDSPWDTVVRKVGINGIIPNDLIKQHYRALIQSNI